MLLSSNGEPETVSRSITPPEEKVPIVVVVTSVSISVWMLLAISIPIPPRTPMPLVVILVLPSGRVIPVTGMLSVIVGWVIPSPLFLVCVCSRDQPSRKQQNQCCDCEFSRCFLLGFVSLALPKQTLTIPTPGDFLSSIGAKFNDTGPDLAYCPPRVSSKPEERPCLIPSTVASPLLP